ncbi:3-methyl-2-oxobutanoate hydroxymethyltransferase [Sulfurimonas sp. MAG313]|nr:3-methyl-2-oxobutanoate hydroxymethyltransferase [Sulfurimonas sp. MAG313]MDF1882074.1 3-methyl-2-oxobutanoate hydroxymethyltransferase [Sulfurimonas sp. MAG313]
MKKKLSINAIKKSKNEHQLTMITAYDALFASLFEESADMILVGDSLNMSFGGKADTLSATLDQMIYHTNAVCNGAKNTFVICDMPFGSYNSSRQALKNAVRVYQECPADAIKIEGGKDKAPLVKILTDNGIAVCGHIGLLPQSVRGEGGYIVRGKDVQDMEQLIEDAEAIEAAGAFAIVVEGVKAQAAKAIALAVNIPIIGIGAGCDVDGQVLVFSDMLGLFEAFTPKFVKKYMDGAGLVKEAVASYKTEVQSKSFPSSEHTY